MGREIDTYDISIIPFEDCCTVFVPHHPVINPKLEIAIGEEEKFDYTSLIEQAVQSVSDIVITSKKDNLFEDIL